MQLIRNFSLKMAAVLAIASSAGIHAQSYKVTNLVSDGSVPAVTTDANFKNPWAISTSGTFWISTANTGYNYVLSPTTSAISFKVIVPTAAAPNTAPGLPAGSVTTGGAVGMLLSNATKASFLFSTLDGTISGWNSKLGTANAISTIMVNNSAAGASYPGMAILNIAANGVTSTSYILAANFGTGSTVEVYDSSFVRTKLPGGFTDPNLPTGYAPYSVHVLGTQVFVAYAQHSTSTPSQPAIGVGNGIVDVYDNTGTFVSRVASNGNLNAPWGVAYAPANFGVFSNDLMIGNFGDGIINVFDPKSFAYLGQLIDSTGKPMQYASLWELLTGGTTVTGTTAVGGGDTSTVYFTAGLASEQHGLLGAISNGVTTGATPTFGFSVSNPALTVPVGGSVLATLQFVPVNGFSGSNVVIACSGLPKGVSCIPPAPVTVSSTASTQALMSLTTTPVSSATVRKPTAIGDRTALGGIAAALLLPFASFLSFRRNRSTNAVRASRILGLAAFIMVSAAVAGGCGSSSSPGVTATPGTSTVTLTATSGSITQQTTVALTVK
jgi:uncharacterized protein (TIGR03118 family)